MFRRKTRSSQGEESKDSHHSSSPVPCSNCIKLMQEISQLREENNELKCDKQRKQYTIAPTLYTYYKSNVLKNRVSRCVTILVFYYCRAASQATQSLLESTEEEDKGAYNEEIINICSQSFPNSFFDSDDFLEIFEQQCQQMSIAFSFLFM